MCPLQERFSTKTQARIDKHFKKSKIPPLDKRSSVDIDSYTEKYQLADHDARFELARAISKNASNITSAKEPRWSAIVKNQLFGKLIESSRKAEGIRRFAPKQLVEGVKVYASSNF
jgi:hypothetical protein